MRRLLVVSGSCCFEKEARQRFEHHLFSLVLELIPHTRLGNGKVGEVQIQLRHGSPDLHPILPVQQCGAGEHRPDCACAASRPASRLTEDSVTSMQGRSPSKRRGLSTYSRPAK